MKFSSALVNSHALAFYNTSLLIANVNPVADRAIDDRTSIPADAIINISGCSMLAPTVRAIDLYHNRYANSLSMRLLLLLPSCHPTFYFTRRC